MKRLLDFVTGNFMTLFNKVTENLKELSLLSQVALALVAVALIFIAVMLLIYFIRISKYRTIKKIENVDVVFFNSVYEFGPYKNAKEGEILFILLIPFTFIINFVIKAFMYRSFSAINSSDYITRRMLENMQLENMKMKDMNKELLKVIDESGLNKKPKKQMKPVPKPVIQETPKETPKELAPKEEEPKVVVEEPKIEEKKQEAAPKKETPKKEVAPEKEATKKEASPEKELPKVEKKEDLPPSSTIVTEADKEPEVILQSARVEEPIMPEREILEAEIIDSENENLDELMGDVATKETRGKA
jgi:hypothetical protein